MRVLLVGQFIKSDINVSSRRGFESIKLEVISILQQHFLGYGKCPFSPVTVLKNHSTSITTIANLDFEYTDQLQITQWNLYQNSNIEDLVDTLGSTSSSSSSHESIGTTSLSSSSAIQAWFYKTLGLISGKPTTPERPGSNEVFIPIVERTKIKDFLAWIFQN